MKKNLILIVALFLTLLASDTASAYTINGLLDDWGVTPFFDWNPDNSSIDKSIENNRHHNINSNSVNDIPGGEPYDVEALYFDDDTDYFYFAMVTSYPLSLAENGLVAGDLAIDFDRSDNYYNYGVQTRFLNQSTTTGETQNTGLWGNPQWDAPAAYEASPLNMMHTGDVFSDILGTYLGPVLVSYRDLGYIEGQYYGLPDPYQSLFGKTYVLEGQVDRSFFDSNAVNADNIFLHWAQTCNNDYIELTGTFDKQVIPEPSTLLLFGLSAIGAGLIRKK